MTLRFLILAALLAVLSVPAHADIKGSAMTQGGPLQSGDLMFIVRGCTGTWPNLTGCGNYTATLAPATVGSLLNTAATAHQFLTGLGSTGAFTAAQPAFSDLSGSLSAAQIPAPQPAALGGVFSLTPVANAFLTGIGTSGAPTYAQPSFANIYGTATNSQLANSFITIAGHLVSLGSTQALACADLTNASPSCSTDATNAANISAGTLPAARLPAPTGSALGGAQSLAAVAHNFLTSLGTSGILVAAQPAASDLSNGVTGAGSVVLAASPTLTTPNIGTATGNITGNAGTVTTNANLTGPITSAGNVTSIASQTGTGSTFAMSASPTFTGTVNVPSLTVNGINGISYPSTDTTTNGTIAIGYNALVATGTASPNADQSVAVGYGAYQLAVGTTGTPTQGVAIGYRAGYQQTTGYNNNIIGWNALFNCTACYWTNAIGHDALGYLTSGYGDTALGEGAGYEWVSGNENTFIGDGVAVFANGSGSANTLVGAHVANGSIGGFNYNTAVGENAGSVLAADGNTLVGTNAGAHITTGQHNLVLGLNAGNGTLATGQGNVLLCPGSTTCDMPASGTNYAMNLANAIYATNIVGSPNAISGSVGIGTNNPLTSLDTRGVVSGNAFESNGTKFTTSGCSVSSTTGGASAGTYTSGTSGACNVVVTMNGATGLTAPNGWDCHAEDRTTTADLITETASTATTATLAGTTASGDVIGFHCVAY